MSLPRQPVPAPGKECSCVLFGRAPDTTATTTLFFSKPKMTVSGFPSQITSATVTLTANLRLDTCALLDTAKMEAMKNILRNFTSKLYAREVRSSRVAREARQFHS